MQPVLAYAPVEIVWAYVAAIIVVVALLGGLGIAAAGIWHATRVKQWEMSLKHSMLEKGMSAADITAVLAATHAGPKRGFRFPEMDWCGRRSRQDA